METLHGAEVSKTFQYEEVMCQLQTFACLHWVEPVPSGVNLKLCLKPVLTPILRTNSRDGGPLSSAVTNPGGGIMADCLNCLILGLALIAHLYC